MKSTWEPPRSRYLLFLPPYLFVMLLTGFLWLPGEERAASWVCRRCAHVLEERREVKLGIPIDGWRRIEDAYVNARLDPLHDCVHEWRRYAGAGANRLWALKTPAVDGFLGSLALYGSAAEDLVRWDLRGERAGAWTRGPFPVLASEEEFRAWFAGVRASDPGR